MIRLYPGTTDGHLLERLARVRPGTYPRTRRLQTHQPTARHLYAYRRAGRWLELAGDACVPVVGCREFDIFLVDVGLGHVVRADTHEYASPDLAGYVTWSFWRCRPEGKLEDFLVFGWGGVRHPLITTATGRAHGRDAECLLDCQGVRLADYGLTIAEIEGVVWC